ncbi:MAG: hypothetical protein ACTHLW_15480 [Verrucomicrobiota bacterium]
MKSPNSLRTTCLLSLALLASGLRAEAQTFGLGSQITSTPTNAGPVNGLITYTILLTNQSQITLPNIFVTNLLPASASFESAAFVNGVGDIFTNAPSVAFTVFPLLQGSFAQMTFSIRPTTAGLLTNQVTIFGFDPGNTNSMVVNEVTNVPLPQADLAVTLSGPASTVYSNDWMTYGVTVSNNGSNSVANAVLTNILPASVGFKYMIPTNQPTVSNNGTNTILRFNLGTLSNGLSQTYRFTVQPTNTGTFAFAASINSTNVQESNSTNNSASTNIVVLDFLPSNLSASVTSTQVFNAQNGMLEQTILLVNNGAEAIDSARVMVSGTTNWLFNAVGTNDHHPFVTYGGTLNSGGGSVSLLLQHFVPSHRKFVLNDTNLIPVAVTAVDLSPPQQLGTNVGTTRILQLSSGNMLIEFPSVLGASYTILYSEDMSFSNTRVIQPSTIVAPANMVQWIDYGPPGTIVAPTNAPSRFYRVYRNP